MPDMFISRLDIQATIQEFEAELGNFNMTFTKVVGTNSSRTKTSYKYTIDDSGTSVDFYVFGTLKDPNILDIKNIVLRSVASYIMPVTDTMIHVFNSIAKMNRGYLNAYDGQDCYVVMEGNPVNGVLAAVPATYVFEYREDDSVQDDDDTALSVQPIKLHIKEYIASQHILKSKLDLLSTQEEKANEIASYAYSQRTALTITARDFSDLLYQCKLFGMSNTTMLSLLDLVRD